MKERNEFLEMDGLFWQSDTHEWFHDKIATNYAQRDYGLHKDALPNLVCFVTRNKETGEYDRVIMDKETNEMQNAAVAKLKAALTADLGSAGPEIRRVDSVGPQVGAELKRGRRISTKKNV